MEAVRRAVIDVGTNSVKLLVAELAHGELRPVCEESRQTRLGHQFYDTHRLQLGPIARTAEAVAEFETKARAAGAGSVRVIATSAARDAVNSADLVSAIKAACGLPIEIISGETEADWAFRGVTTDKELAQATLLLLDVGGGSTEFILGRGKERKFCRSFPLGTVRLLERCPHQDPPTPEELSACRQWLRGFLDEHVAPELAPLLREDPSSVPGERIQLVGTGGTASILGCLEAQLAVFDREKLEKTRVTHERIEWQVQRLWSLPLEDRRHLVGLPSNRADVILTGAAIYETVMQYFGFDQLRISTRGLRFAAVMDDPPPGEMPGNAPRL